MSINLDPRPARTDLTSRECSKLLGGMIGNLSQMASLLDIRTAVRWWAETDEAWDFLALTLGNRPINPLEKSDKV